MLDTSIMFSTYFLLFSFWSAKVLDLKISGLKGISLFNASLYIAMILYCFVLIRRKQFFARCVIYKYLLTMLFVGIISIPIKILSSNFEHIRISQEIILFKNWSEGILLFLIFYNLFESKKLCKRTIWALIILFIFSNVTMLLDTYGVIKIGKITQDRLGESSGFGNPNDFAAYMLLFFPFLFSKLFIKSNKIVKSLVIICLIISILAFIMTGSRGGFIAFIIGVSIYLAFIKKYILKFKLVSLMKYAIFIFILLLIPILLLPNKFFNNMAENINPSGVQNIEDYSHGREKFWIGGIKIFLGSPIYGYGLNTFPSLLKKTEGITATAHNKYLLYLVQFGLIGLIVYLLLQIALFIQAYRPIRSSDDKYYNLIFINYLSGLSSFSVAIFFVDGDNTQTPFWLLSAAVCRLAQLYINGNKEKALETKIS